MQQHLRRYFSKNITALTVILFLSIQNNFCFSQTYEIDAFDGQTVTTCSGTFTDSDPSSTGNYGNNENYTITFCSGSASFLTFDFDVSGFYDPLSAGDTLYMYDGVGTTGDLIMQIDGTDDPSFSQFMLSSLSTCVTFQFISDGALNNDGWGAIISCTTPPADCNGNPAAADISAQAPFICNLDGYCGNTSNYYHEDLPFNMTSGGNCPSTQAFLGTIENNSWLVFEATSTTVDLDFIVSGCGGDGIQAAIMQYDGSNWVRYSDCATSDGSNSGAFTMSAAGMTPGEIYYIMVDGNAGANCDYTINVNGNGVAVLNAGVDQDICENDDASITATGPSNATYTWHSLDGLITNVTGASQTFSPTVTTTYVVEITDGGICEDQTDTIIVTVNTAEDASFSYTPVSYCTTDSDPVPSITGTSGGTFTIDNGGTIDATTGEIDLTGSGVGSYIITYTTNGSCPDSETITINITDCATPCDPEINAAGPFCQTASSINLTAADAGGTWSGTGITNATNGTFDPATAGTGNHTVTYTLGCGDSDTETITVTATDDGSFTYAQTSYCATDSDPTPTITGLAGGTFSINNGGTIDATSGIIDLSGSGINTFVVSYLTSGTCPTTETFDITITNAADATITAAGPFCQTASSINLTASDASGTWSGTGITNATNGTFDPVTAGPGNHIITYTIAGSCGDTDTETITVTATDDGSFTYAQTSYCATDSDPTPTITGLAGGTFSINNGGTIDATSGIIDLSGSGINTFVVSYLTSGTCPITETFDITITNAADATITAAGPFCQTASSINLTASDASGTWSGTGITNATNGTFDPVTAGPGNHIITYTIAGSCGDTDTETITVTATDDGSFTYTQTSYCASDSDPNPTITGLTGGTFSINNGGTIDATSGIIDLSGSGINTFVVSYLTSGTCPTTETFDVTITNTADATITAAGPFCQTASSINLTAADAGGTWAGTGITNTINGTFDPATAGPGNHIITYTIAGSCGDTDTETITVTATDDGSFTYAQTSYCVSDSDPTPTITGLTGGTFSINNGGSINPSTGAIDLTASGANSYTINYLTSGTCPTTENFDITITSLDNISFNYNSSFCLNEANPSPNNTGTLGGIYSINNGGSIDPNTGVINLSQSGTGSFEITYSTSGLCGNSSTYPIVINPSADASINTAGPFCLNDGESVLTAIQIGGTWSGTGITDDIEGIFNPSTAGEGNHDIIYTINGNCGDSDTIQVIVYPQPIIQISSDTLIEEGGLAILNIDTEFDIFWTPSETLDCDDCDRPIASPLETTTYCATVTDTNNCVAEACVEISIKINCGDVFVPTAFSPNNDSNNDFECVYGNCITDMTFKVFDRWGELVYESSDLTECWDGTFRGKLLSTGVYVYTLQADLSNGEVVNKKGNINLIR